MFKLEFNAQPVTRQLKKLEKIAETHAEDVIVPMYFQRLQSIASKAAELARIEIKLATTKTGRARAARGEGQPGRLETEAFYNNFKWQVTKVSRGTYAIRLGWLDGQPDWASYQELGFQHRSGMYVTGADALGAAHRYAENEINKLRKS